MEQDFQRYDWTQEDMIHHFYDKFLGSISLDLIPGIQAKTHKKEHLGVKKGNFIQIN